LDSGKKKGQFYLSGSQQFEMMKNVSESLAGRLGILNLHGLSLRELYGVKSRAPFLPTDGYFAERQKDKAGISYADVWNIIHRGSFPEICANPDYEWKMFFGAYVTTYIERDVRGLAQVGDIVKFTRFMTITASCTGQLLNLSSIARDAGVSQPTTERWLSVLAASNIVYLLKPYYNNITKRAVKTPKLYFMDTGLAAYLTRWNTPDVLKNGAMAGAFFETFIVSEIIKSYSNAGILDLPLYFYRDRDGNEIDLLIENGGTLHPIEIKKHADPAKSDIAKLMLLDKIPNIQRGQGGVICMYDSLVTLQGNDKSIPVALL
jgi:predicted AAA+ superfamily ATPase